MARWFFSYAFVDRFVLQLLEEVAQQLPAADARSEKLKTAAKQRLRYESALITLIDRCKTFHHNERLNFFQRGRLSQQVQNGLLGRGYPPELASEVAVQIAGACN